MAAIPVEWLWFPNQESQGFELQLPVLTDRYQAGGPFVPMSLCLHAVPGDPTRTLYTSVWVRWPSAASHPAVRFRLLVDHDDAEAWLESEATYGRYPYLVAAARTGPSTRFTFVTSDSARPTHPERDDGRPVRRSVASPGVPVTTYGDDLEGHNAYAEQEGWFPEWVAPYGRYPGNANAAIIWREQPSRGGPTDPLYSEGWVQRGLNVVPNHDVAQANGALVSSFAYPRVLGIVNGDDPQTPGHVMLHDNDAIEGIGQVLDVGVNRLQQKMNELATAGLWPISLMGSDAGDNQRFNIVYATCGHIAPPQRFMRTSRLTMSGITETQASATSGASLGSVEGFAISSATTRTAVAGRPLAPSPPVVAVPGRPGRAVADGIGLAQAGTSIGPLSPATSGFVPSGEVVTLGLPPEPAPESEASPPDPGNIAAAAYQVFAPVDDWVMRLMRQHGVRAAQLAVAHEGELKYAAAYTWAPVDYPVTTVVQRMRVGSISKVFCSMALVRMAEGVNTEERVIDLFDPLTANLITLMPPAVIADPGWISRTAAQLACHVGYFDEKAAVGTVDPWTVIKALFAQGKPIDMLVPLPPELQRDYLLTVKPPSTQNNDGYFLAKDGVRVPAGTLTTTGLQRDWIYSNFGYNRLGDVIAQQSGGTYFEFLRDNIMVPLRIPLSRIEKTIARAVNAPSTLGEVRYHARIPALVVTSRAYRPVEEDVPPEADGWGTWHYDGTNWELGEAAGFLAVAAIDVVRLFASFDLRSHPILQSQASIDMLIGDTYAKDRTLAFFKYAAPPVSPASTPGAPGLGHGGGTGGLGTGNTSLGQAGADDSFLWHNGSYVGLTALAFRDSSGLVAALTLNADIFDGPTLAFGFELRDMLHKIRMSAGFPPWNLFSAPGVLA